MANQVLPRMETIFLEEGGAEMPRKTVTVMRLRIICLSY
jgi:hypothetical protein